MPINSPVHAATPPHAAMPPHAGAWRKPPRPYCRRWHAALFWLAANAPGALVPWREDLFPGFISPSWRPPGAIFPVVWFVITVAALVAGRRAINLRHLPRRRRHLALQGAFWLMFIAFPFAFFGLSSPILGAVLTVAILLVAIAEVAMLRRDDPVSAGLLLPLLLWAGFAGLYLAPTQALLNPDPLFGTGAPLGPTR